MLKQLPSSRERWLLEVLPRERRVEGLGVFGVQGLGFRAWGLGCGLGADL